MKFPLPVPALDPVALCADKRATLEALATRELERALRRLDAFCDGGRQVDRARWKPVKTREGVAVYRERPRRHERGRDWRLPRLLGVGTLQGTLDDVMYGTMSPTASSVMVKADYCADDVADAQVLLELRGPTLQRPFQFVGLKWLVKKHPGGMDAVVLPRDLVYLENTGVVKRPDGSRVGHFLIHSVEIPGEEGTRDLRDLGIIRSRISSCFLFTERPGEPGCIPVVDVYMTGQVEPNGRMIDRAAMLSTASGLMRFSRAIVCAQHRKLAWRLRTRPPASPHPPTSNSVRCSVCARPFGKFAASGSCSMCNVRSICSRCVVNKTLSFVGRGANDRVTHRVQVSLCRPCVLVTSRTDAATIAREEILAGEYGHADKTPSKADAETAHKSQDGEIGLRSARSTDLSLAYLDDLFLRDGDPIEDELDDDDDWKSLLMDDDISGEYNSSIDSESSAESRASPPATSVLGSSSSSGAALGSSPSSALSASSSSNELWAQVSALRRVAEATYRLARENTEHTLMMSQGPRGEAETGGERKSLITLLPPKTVVP